MAPPHPDDMALPVCSTQTTALTDYLPPSLGGPGVELTRPTASEPAKQAGPRPSSRQRAHSRGRGIPTWWRISAGGLDLNGWRAVIRLPSSLVPPLSWSPTTRAHLLIHPAGFGSAGSASAAR
jgi:hypothetical protein